MERLLKAKKRSLVLGHSYQKRSICHKCHFYHSSILKAIRRGKTRANTVIQFEVVISVSSSIFVSAFWWPGHNNDCK